jgi:lysophospholipase L1-like esterase
MSRFPLQIGSGVLHPEIEDGVLFLDVVKQGVTYTLPYLQSSPDLEVSADFSSGEVEAVAVSLFGRGFPAGEALLTPDAPSAVLPGLRPGEYRLEAHAAEAPPAADAEVAEDAPAAVAEADNATVAEAPVPSVLLGAFSRIGIGTIFAALGDSTTEGYFGNDFMVTGNLTAMSFPFEAISGDARNFPQPAPTAAQYCPKANCFQSWMPELNNLLSASLHYPVFIANEGWGGYATTDYLRVIYEDAEWQARMRLLKPRAWLIHLGVNDGGAGVAPDAFEANMTLLVEELMGEWGAVPERIFLARPCYNFAEGAEALLYAYSLRIDDLVKRLGLSAGPDFFEAYALDREVWYGDDPVHPNVEGMTRMAELWADAILRALAHQ